MQLWLFSPRTLIKELDASRLKVSAVHGIHAITNLLPSPVMHRNPPSTTLRRIAVGLSCCEGALGSWPPFRRLGCSIFIVARKEP